MSSDSSIDNNLDLTGALSSLNIGSNKEKDATSNNDTDVNTVAILCANCGKKGGDEMNTCNKCDLVVYCNVACKKRHRSKHKKKCEKRAAEFHDEALFNEPPPQEDCPICMLPPPLYDNYTGTGMTFHSCCGKLICDGCKYAMAETGAKNMKLCPFCKTPNAISEEKEVERIKKLMKKGNAYAFYQLASYYANGIRGLPQDWEKANELWLQAGELGCAEAYFSLGNAYNNGRGVEIDKKKAKHYYELAAMNGHALARHNLGCTEYEAGKYDLAFKHLIIAASAGFKESLENVKYGYTYGRVTKDEYANTLRACQKSQDEMKSDTRDEAWALCNSHR